MFSFLKNIFPANDSGPPVVDSPPQMESKGKQTVQRADMLLLGEFIKPKLATKAAKHWARDARSSSLARLIASGDIVRPPLVCCLDVAYVVGDLKALLKARELAVSGSKSELIQRLIDAGIEQDSAVHGDVYQCSEAAAVKLTAWQSHDCEEAEKSLLEIVALLSARKVIQAHAAAKSHKNRFLSIQSLDDRPNSLAIDVPPEQNQKRLENILCAKPLILAGLSEGDLERVRLSAALCELGCNQSGVWRQLLESIQLARFRVERLPMLVRMFADNVTNVGRLKKLGLVSFTASSSASNCPECHSLDGMQFAIDATPEIPNPKCERDGCLILLKPSFQLE